MKAIKKTTIIFFKTAPTSLSRTKPNVNTLREMRKLSFLYSDQRIPF